MVAAEALRIVNAVGAGFGGEPSVTLEQAALLLALRVDAPATADQIAAVLQLPPQTVRKRLSRAARDTNKLIVRHSAGSYALSAKGRARAEVLAAQLFHRVTTVATSRANSKWRDTCPRRTGHVSRRHAGSL